ncbi:MAG: Hsp33 family molecular chaperone HslO [Kangiella sp.]|nr:Hsp33 family molecular chaperone HslO [Kangiella sp.]
MSDLIQRFTFADLPVRGEIISLEHSFHTICDQHQYSHTLRHLLGEALAATALMADIIKIEGKVSLQLQSPSQVKLLVTECNNNGHIRGVMHPLDPDVTHYNFKGWTEGGTLAITIEPEQGHRYQGIVSLEKDSFSECLEDYFTSSEQLPTYLKLYVGKERITGIFLQAMPDSDNQGQDNKTAFEHVTTLAETITDEEALTISHHDLLFRLYHQDKVTLYDEKSIKFQCSCSRERNERALLTIEPQELIQLAEEHNGQIELVCDFCSKKEVFTQQQLAELITTNQGTGAIN